METLNFAFAFSAGVLATFNPCAWAMLPTFISFYLGSREAEYEQRSFAARAAEGPLHQKLSEREFQVLLRLARGAAAGQIAQDMQLSVKTISTYRSRIFQKMGLSSNTDLTYYAIKNGLID